MGRDREDEVVDVEARLTAAAPVAQPWLDAADLGGADDALLDAIVASGDAGRAGTASLTALPTPRRTRQRAARTAAVAVAVLSLAAAGWAVVDARTGVFGRGTGSEERGGEMIRLDAPGAPAVVDGIARGIPLPPGGTFDRWRAATLAPTPGRGDGVVMTESAIATSLSLDAACQWTGYWLDAHAAGDAAAAGVAVRVLAEIPDWPAIVDADADGVRVLLRARAEGARAGDPTRFVAEYSANCPGTSDP